MTPSNPASDPTNYDVDVIEAAFDDEDRRIEEAFDRDSERRMAEGYNDE